MTKILLVEDDKSLREIYGVRLLAEGYDIISAGDGEEALAMAIKDRPALIVSDVMMPKISGFDMLDILRSTTETKNIKVIMMTALSSEEQRQRGVSLGADRYLVKSQVGIEDVVRTVHEVLGDAPVAGQAPLMSQKPAAPTVAPAPHATPPVSAPTPTPERPAPAPTHAPLPSPQSQSAHEGSLPQPTAPFSTPRPANLADRIIQPLQQAPDSGPNFADLINKELSGADTPAAPVETPSSPALQPAQAASPTMPATPQLAPAAPTPQTPPPIETPAPNPAEASAPVPTPQPIAPSTMPPATSVQPVDVPSAPVAESVPPVPTPLQAAPAAPMAPPAEPPRPPEPPTTTE